MAGKDDGLLDRGKGGFLRTVWRIRRVLPYLRVGYGYASSAVAIEPRGAAPGPGTRDTAGRPGTRLPHVWLSRWGGERVSSLDLLGGKFTLWTARGGQTWCEAARAAASELGVPLACVRVGLDVDDPKHRWAAANGLRSAGAVLVRPDGFVCWRSRRAPLAPDAEAAALTEVLRRLLSSLVRSGGASDGRIVTQ